MPLNFAVLDINTAKFHNGLCFSVTTDVPCHLTMYWSNNRPKVQPTSIIFRGLRIHRGFRWCFTAYTGLEQKEPGDTLIHTFPWVDWPLYARKWWVLRGTIADVLSPSVGPVVESYNDGLNFFYNTSFDDWPDPPVQPFFWTLAVTPGDQVKCERVPHWRDWAIYDARVYTKGYDSIGTLGQRQSSIYLRNQGIRITVWHTGNVSTNTGLYVAVNGTGAWGKWCKNTNEGNWQKLIVLGTVPKDSTDISIGLRNYRNHIRWGYSTFSYLRLEVVN